MKAHEVMSRNVISVKPSTLVREVAALLAEKRISGVPVVSEDGQVVGIVSETDLLHRAELGTDKPRKSWMTIFADADQLARDYTKTHGLHASQIMSRHVVSVSDETELRDVVNMFDRHRFKRIPVIRDGKLVGMITRGDVVRALNRQSPAVSGGQVSDADLQQTLLKKIRDTKWLFDSFLNLAVKDGVVELWGMVGSDDQRKALTVIIEETPGVKRISDNTKIGQAFAAIY